MVTRSTMPAFAAVLFAINFPTIAAPLNGSPAASTAASSPLSRIEHDRSDDSDRREARSDERRSENDTEGRRGSDHADLDDDREESANRRGGGRAASFWLRSGDLRLEVKCPRGEPMRACVDAALTLLDKARSAQNQPAAPSSDSPTSQGH